MKFVKIAVILTIAIQPLVASESVSYDKYRTILRKAQRIYRTLPTSGIRWKTLGRLQTGKRVYYGTFGFGEKLTLIVGGMHGDEPVGVISAVRLAAYISRNPVWLKNRVIIIPCMNPDGLEKGTRMNGRDVDLNRNFPTETWSPDSVSLHNNPGELPASEIETVLLSNLIEDCRPDMIIQLHQPLIGLYPDEGTSPDLLRTMSDIADIPVVSDIGYKTPGSLSSLKSTFDFNVQMITYELCSIDEEPSYGKIIMSLLEAINY
jgi:succinylglutamate desuccinylase